MDRAWQKKLHASVRDDGHKAEIYKYLWMLMTEGDPTVFQNNLEAFRTFWEKKEPEFISYFKDYYANRVGEYTKANYALHCKQLLVFSSHTLREMGTRLQAF